MVISYNCISGKYSCNKLSAGLRFSRQMLDVSPHNFPGSGHDPSCLLLFNISISDFHSSHKLVAQDFHKKYRKR